MVKKMDLSELFRSLQDEMLATLGILEISHPTAKGDFCELNWLKFFQEKLPKRYQAEKAFVVDSNGRISDAIDIVIFDNHFSPFLLNKNGVKYIPAESVYAVFEVKQDLNSSNLKYAMKKAKSVRQLYRTTMPINNAGQMQPAKNLQAIIAGILTSRLKWVKNHEKQLQKNLRSADTKSELDIGCSIDGLCFYRESKGIVVCDQKKNILVTFFLQLLNGLQKVGTVPAMDVLAYSPKK
jgi:hypothetical protein